MLRSRRRAASNPASNKPPSASASLAATKAFIRDRESNGVLSSAAAAAALRTHTTTPTPVGDTVTKRMVRKASVSSQGSGVQHRPALRRHSSSGSMTERTFRVPSPNGSSMLDRAAPPIPAVPKRVPQASVVHRRNSSLEPPARAGSPVERVAGRGTSLDRGADAAQHGRGPARPSPLSQVVESPDRDGGHRSSINFSRPISPQQAPSPTPPAPAPARGRQTGWFSGPVVDPEQTFRGEKPRPKTSGGVSAHTTQQAGRHAADRPVSIRSANGLEGARIATGSMRAKPSGTAVQPQQTYTAAKDRPVRIVDPSSPFAVYDPSSRKFIHKQDAMNLHRAMSNAEDPAPPYQPQQAVHQNSQEAPRRTQPGKQVAPARNVIQRAPSVSPIRDASQPIASARRNPTPVSTTQPGVAHLSHQHQEPVTFTAKEFVEAEEQPSSYANTSRELESPVPEVNPEHQDMVSPKFAPNQDSAYPRLEPPRRASTPSGPADALDGEQLARSHSTSPSRNARFAAVAVELPHGVKHQPPARSVSPAKSALKASPSVSRRGHSPLANDGRILSYLAPSDASDVASEDSVVKRKKKVRISFEEQPTVLGTSAYVYTDEPNDVTGPSDSQWGIADEQEHLGDFMKPRPVLPSFGSIRDKNRRPNDEDMPEKVTETVSSSISNSATLVGDPTDTSSDRKIGGILAQDFASNKANDVLPDDPLPPQVTSVDGSGYYSDSSEEANSVYIRASEPQKPHASLSLPDPEPKTLTVSGEIRSGSLELPVIAVQPASPPIPQEDENKFETVTASTSALQQTPTVQSPAIPGGWEEEDAAEPETEDQPSTSAVRIPNQPSITIQIPERPLDNDSSDDNDSVYSDAYEDITDGEGFGSIDAIMESPVVAPSSRFTLQDPSPSDTRVFKTGLETSRWAPTNSEKAHQDSDLVQVQQSQSGLLINNLAVNAEPTTTTQAPSAVIQTREAPEPSYESASVVAISKPTGRRAKAESTETQPRAPQAQPTKVPAQVRKSAMKKTTTQPPPAAPLKTTMRSRAPVSTTPEPQMRKTMRGADGAFAGRGPSVPAAQRQSMPPMDTRPPRGALQKKHAPAAAMGATGRTRPQSASGVPTKSKAFSPPAPAYESDSDASVSSFQRERQRTRASRNNNGMYTMRASMRSGPTPTMRAAPPVESIPPPPTSAPPPSSTLRKSMRPTSPTSKKAIRTSSPISKKSMRPSSPTPESSGGVKPSRFSIRSLSPAGRFRRSSTYDAAPPLPSIPTQAPSPKPTKSMFGKSKETKPSGKAAKPFRSRFNNSSDEDEDDRPRRFQSRFADSDSEDEGFTLPQGLTPVRGIPRRPGEEDGDSTDLEDEASDNELATAPVTSDNNKAKTAPTTTVASAQGSNLAAGSLRQPELPSFDAGKKKAKRGFFGFGKKKNSYLAEAKAEAAASSSPGFDIPLPPAQPNRDHDRPLTPIGEDHSVNAGEATTNAPKTGGRTPFGRSASDSWPLATPNAPFAGDERPLSADGPIKRKSSSGRPTLVKRNPSEISQTKTDVGRKSSKEALSGRTGKKKKFHGLRRVFGLND